MYGVATASGIALPKPRTLLADRNTILNLTYKLLDQLIILRRTLLQPPA